MAGDISQDEWQKQLDKLDDDTILLITIDEEEDVFEIKPQTREGFTEIQNKCVDWLLKEYDEEEATESIKYASITNIGSIYTITYFNGVKDVIEIIGNKITHITK